MAGTLRRVLPVVACAALLSALTAAMAARPFQAPVRLELGGGFPGAFIEGESLGSGRVDLQPEQAPTRKAAFYFARPGALLRVNLPFKAPGVLGLTLRLSAPDGRIVEVAAASRQPQRIFVRPGPWKRVRLELETGSRVDLLITHRPIPERPGEISQLWVDYLEVSAASGLVPRGGATMTVAAVPLVLVLFALGVGAGARVALAAGAVAAAVAVPLFRAAPLPVLAALPRLLPAALLLGLAVHLALRALNVARASRLGLVALVFVGVLGHGSVAFHPNHNPPDREVHIIRALDAGRVPPSYQGWLLYGSHFPTASQYKEKATLLFGEAVIIPYSPLPALAYYALHRIGLDLEWALTTSNTVLAMAAAVALWLAARRLWSTPAAWVAAGLYTLDLAVWHHLGRVHAPAAFAGALATMALAYLALRSGSLVTRQSVLPAALLLGLASLGYSSYAALFGLFGCVLLALLAFDARALSLPARRGLALTVVLAGLLAGVLYYFHYIPGFLRGADTVSSQPDLFTGRTFWIFRNEAKQSLRVWRLGYWLWLVAGLIAAPVALARVRPESRPVLTAWLGAWMLIMVLKDPFLFPRLLRWAKEDQFLSPLLCLLIGAAVWSLPDRRMRWIAAALALGTAAWLQLRDFQLHANSLLL